jgi:ABC-type uncharacterized transport system substrate-binding protein
VRLALTLRVIPVMILTLLAAPLVAGAQPPAKLYRLGLLGRTSPQVSSVWGGFFQRLQELGYVEGLNVGFEGRWYGDNIDRLPSLAAELVRLPVDVIVAGAAPAPEAAKGATSAIPIVKAAVHSDAVGTGLVTSLARPGGNVTRLSAAIPSLTRVAVLSNPTVPSHAVSVREGAARGEGPAGRVPRGGWRSDPRTA